MAKPILPRSKQPLDDQNDIIGFEFGGKIICPECFPKWESEAEGGEGSLILKSKQCEGALYVCDECGKQIE